MRLKREKGENFGGGGGGLRKELKLGEIIRDECLQFPLDKGGLLFSVNGQKFVDVVLEIFGAQV